MLRKLMKHEFRATGRIMGPLYLVLLVISVCANGSVRILDTSTSRFLNIVSGVILFLLVAGIMAVCIVTLVLMVNRFRTNLLGDEGYVTLTLPASVHQQIWAKILVSVVWGLASLLAVLVSLAIVTFRVQDVADLLRFARYYLSQLTAYYAINGTAFVLEALALFFVSYTAGCLEFYAAMAVGHSFPNHKSLLSVVFFVVFLIALQIVGMTGLLNFPDLHFGGAAAIHAFMGLSIGAAAVVGAVFYWITAVFLKKHLNLE